MFDADRSVTPRHRIRGVADFGERFSQARRRGFGVTSWLIMLVSVPVVTVAVLTGATVVRAGSAVSDAEEFNRGVSNLAELVAVRDGMLAQLTLEAFDVRFEELGVTTSDASAFIGVDLAARVAPARTRTDDAVAAMGPDSPISAATLRDLYTAIDGDSTSTTAAEAQLSELANTVDSAVVSAVTALDRNLGGSTQAIVADLRSLRAVLNIDRVATLQGIDLSVLWFPSEAATRQTTAEAAARLAGETAEYAASSARVHEFGVMTEELTKIEQDPGVRAFDESVDSALRGEPVPMAGVELDTTQIATTFHGFLNRTNLLDELVAASTRLARDSARHSATSERTAFWAWIVVATGLALLSIKLALMAAGAIAKPVRDLSDYAHALNEGQLDTPVPHDLTDGPRETRVAFAVVSTLAESLRLIDAKANALATGAFQDPVLSESLPGRLGRSLEASGTLLVDSIRERDTAWRQSMQRLARAVELRDDATGQHIERVASYCELIARELGLSATRCGLIRDAAPLHDLGKIAIPDQILLKPGRLTAEERRIVERHCELGHQLLAGSRSELLELAATIALTHHERHDGTGYPRHLAGAEIPLEGRIAAVADVFDALTSDRAYRPAMTIEDAVALMLSERGAHFAPDILDALLRRRADAERLWARFHASARAELQLRERSAGEVVT